MDMMSEERAVGVANRGGRRRRRSIEEKRRIVEQTLVPGASVASIAREHDMNANLLFIWRRLYQQGLLEPQRADGPTTLVPVKLESDSSPSPATRFGKLPSRRERSLGSIEIDFPGGQRLKVVGQVDGVLLAQIVTALSRR